MKRFARNLSLLLVLGASLSASAPALADVTVTSFRQKGADFGGAFFSADGCITYLTSAVFQFDKVRTLPAPPAAWVPSQAINVDVYPTGAPGCLFSFETLTWNNATPERNTHIIEETVANDLSRARLAGSASFDDQFAFESLDFVFDIRWRAISPLTITPINDSYEDGDDIVTLTGVQTHRFAKVTGVIKECERGRSPGAVIDGICDIPPAEPNFIPPAGFTDDQDPDTGLTVELLGGTVVEVRRPK